MVGLGFCFLIKNVEILLHAVALFLFSISFASICLSSSCRFPIPFHFIAPKLVAWVNKTLMWWNRGQFFSEFLLPPCPFTRNRHSPTNQCKWNFTSVFMLVQDFLCVLGRYFSTTCVPLLPSCQFTARSQSQSPSHFHHVLLSPTQPRLLIQKWSWWWIALFTKIFYYLPFQVNH